MLLIPLFMIAHNLSLIDSIICTTILTLICLPIDIFTYKKLLSAAPECKWHFNDIVTSKGSHWKSNPIVHYAESLPKFRWYRKGHFYVVPAYYNDSDVIYFIWLYGHNGMISLEETADIFTQFPEENIYALDIPCAESGVAVWRKIRFNYTYGIGGTNLTLRFNSEDLSFFRFSEELEPYYVR